MLEIKMSALHLMNASFHRLMTPRSLRSREKQSAVPKTKTGLHTFSFSSLLHLQIVNIKAFVGMPSLIKIAIVLEFLGYSNILRKRMDYSE
ncbi:hypothetical protein CEXT_304571 [Caerostris extrusa]|uniref:Uncharacterized protein n=1 Tax=Caerostris extrusa TaxID=172846 RepID=A0AAV4YDZ8_CAEEX|nr:hypothetical protein CEXT_304571 [Caerostris extrusa]